jgi:hypothetical protein
MNKLITIIYCLPLLVVAQSYSPPAGQPGSTAIHMDSPLFTGWASGIDVIRGYINIEDKNFEINGSNRVSFGDPNDALGKANGNSMNVVSLGDSGVAILTFDRPIMNGPGFDFAVFENSFSDDYLEFAHVEVSSDGERFVRFPSHSEVQTLVQIHGMGLTDTRRIHNLAGKYRAGYGTPFDLDDLLDSTDIDLNHITHVKLIDVGGSIGVGGTNDSYGNRINEPFSTPYETGGFDLDAVGVIHQLVSIQKQEKPQISVYPNPSINGCFSIKSDRIIQKIELFNQIGELIEEIQVNNHLFIYTKELNSGMYIIQTWSDKGKTNTKLSVLK